MTGHEYGSSKTREGQEEKEEEEEAQNYWMGQ